MNEAGRRINLAMQSPWRRKIDLLLAVDELMVISQSWSERARRPGVPPRTGLLSLFSDLLAGVVLPLSILLSLKMEGRLADEPALILVTYRPGESNDHHPWNSLAAQRGSAALTPRSTRQEVLSARVFTKALVAANWQIRPAAPGVRLVTPIGAPRAQRER